MIWSLFDFKDPVYRVGVKSIRPQSVKVTRREQDDSAVFYHLSGLVNDIRLRVQRVDVYDFIY